MEFLDEESRPRFLFQSRSSPIQSSLPESKTLDLHKPTIFISLSLSSLLFALSLIYLESEPLKSIIFWFALSLLLGPFAPSSITAGDIRVGVGPVIQPPPPDNEEETNPADSNKKSSGRRSKARKQDELGFNLIPVVANNGPVKTKKSRDSYSDRETGDVSAVIVGEEIDWSEADLDLLKKQMVKYPVGMPGRWDAIAEAFGGRHGAESVIKAAKSTGGKKISDSDSFSRFLKDRKPVDKRVEDELAAESGGGAAAAAAGGGWSAGEDIALLNALKAFPKEAAMRWEKITAAVPGRSKAACMKRVADLKRDFRSSKASVEG